MKNKKGIYIFFIGIIIFSLVVGVFNYFSECKSSYFLENDTIVELIAISVTVILFTYDSETQRKLNDEEKELTKESNDINIIFSFITNNDLPNIFKYILIKNQFAYYFSRDYEQYNVTNKFNSDYGIEIRENMLHLGTQLGKDEKKINQKIFDSNPHYKNIQELYNGFKLINCFMQSKKYRNLFTELSNLKIMKENKINKMDGFNELKKYLKIKKITINKIEERELKEKEIKLINDYLSSTTFALEFKKNVLSIIEKEINNG